MYVHNDRHDYNANNLDDGHRHRVHNHGHCNHVHNHQ